MSEMSDYESKYVTRVEAISTFSSGHNFITGRGVVESMKSRKKREGFVGFIYHFMGYRIGKFWESVRF